MVYDFYDSISQIRVVKNKGKENESLQDKIKEQKGMTHVRYRIR